MARRFFLSAALSVSIAAPMIAQLAGPTLCRAEDAPADVANSRNSALATINADGVYVRSGPGDSYYPTTKLNKDTQVTIVGEKFDWLKIVPPANSFCYVAKAFVDKNPTDATVGVANREDVNVRAGSELNTIKTSVQSKLSAGQRVQIFGEVDEYYKIAPPADAYVYVKKDYVELKKLIPQVAQQPASTELPGATAPDAAGSAVAVGATTQPSGVAPTDIASATTQPAVSVAAAETTFDKLEAQFTDASTKTIEQQPLDEMTAGYTKLLADASLPQSMKQIADFRLQTLKVRSATRDEFVATQKQQAEAKQKQVAMKAEQEEIAQQIKEKDVQIYAAVGTLRTSSLQLGTATIYRLTDPQTGRTVCYIRSDDAKYGTMLGQFIGVSAPCRATPA